MFLAVLLVPAGLGLVAPLPASLALAVFAVAIPAAIGCLVGALVSTSLLALATAALVVSAIAVCTSVTSPVVIAAAAVATIGAGLTAVSATAISGTVVVTGHPGFTTVLAVLGTAVVTVGAARLFPFHRWFTDDFLTAEEIRNLTAKFAEQAIGLFGRGLLRCLFRGRCGRNRANGFHRRLFADRWLGSRGLEDFFFPFTVFLSDLVARYMLHAGLIVTHAQDLEVRCFHVRCGNHHHFHFLACFDVGQLLTLLV